MSCRLGQILVSDVSNSSFGKMTPAYREAGTQLFSHCVILSLVILTQRHIEKATTKGCRTLETVIGQRMAWWQFHSQGPTATQVVCLLRPS